MTGQRVFRGAPATKAEVVGALDAALKAARAGALGDLHIRVHAPYQGDQASVHARLMVIRRTAGSLRDEDAVEVGEWVPAEERDVVTAEPVEETVKRTVVKRKS